MKVFERSLRRSCLGAMMVVVPPSLLLAQATVNGTVRDSLAGGSFARATVQLLSAAAPWEAGAVVTSDSSGRFSFYGVAPGQYQIGFVHPRLDSLGFDAVSRAVTVPRSSLPITADIALPSARTLSASICGARRDTTGVLLGRVLAADGSLPGSQATVVVEWGELILGSDGMTSTRASVRAPVGRDGRYAACGVPTDVPVLVRASIGDSVETDASGTIELKFVSDVPLLHRDLFVAAHTSTSNANATTDSALGGEQRAASKPARRVSGTSTIVGRVIAPGGQPLAGARVRLLDVRLDDAYVTTDAAGGFRFRSLPAGTFGMEVIAIGFTPTRASVDLRPNRASVLSIMIDARVATLDAITVYSPKSREAIGFEARRKRGLGYFLTGEQVRARGTLLSFVLLSAPTLRAVDTRFGRPVVRGLGNCLPTVYLDGFPLLAEDADDLDRAIGLHQVGAVEVYSTTFEAPARFSRPPPRFRSHNLDGTCASIVLWSKLQVP